MNRISVIALFAAATLAMLPSASAQTLSETKVPFAFYVNGTMLPAGTYVVSSHSANFIEIVSTDGKHPAQTVLTRDNSQGRFDGSAKLVFKAYGNQYFLHEIVSPVHETDAVVPTSGQEKQARVMWAAKSGGQPVLVALK